MKLYVSGLISAIAFSISLHAMNNERVVNGVLYVLAAQYTALDHDSLCALARINKMIHAAVLEGAETRKAWVTDQVPELLGVQSFESLCIMAGMVVWNKYGTVCGFIKPEKNNDIYTYMLYHMQIKDNALAHYSFPITTLKTGWGVMHTCNNNASSEKRVHGNARAHLDFPRPTLDGCVTIEGPRFEISNGTVWIGASYQDGSYKKHRINNAGLYHTEVCASGHKPSSLNNKPSYKGIEMMDYYKESQEPVNLQKLADELIVRWMNSDPRQS